jgi:hypothetical protein
MRRTGCSSSLGTVRSRPPAGIKNLAVTHMPKVAMSTRWLRDGTGYPARHRTVSSSQHNGGTTSGWVLLRLRIGKNVGVVVCRMSQTSDFGCGQQVGTGPAA